MRDRSDSAAIMFLKVISQITLLASVPMVKMTTFNIFAKL